MELIVIHAEATEFGRVVHFLLVVVVLVALIVGLEMDTGLSANARACSTRARGARAAASAAVLIHEVITRHSALNNDGMDDRRGDILDDLFLSDGEVDVAAACGDGAGTEGLFEVGAKLFIVPQDLDALGVALAEHTFIFAVGGGEQAPHRYDQLASGVRQQLERGAEKASHGFRVIVCVRLALDGSCA
eukprot:1286575-Pleurochrysis_carterae.AAC.1